MQAGRGRSDMRKAWKEDPKCQELLKKYVELRNQYREQVNPILEELRQYRAEKYGIGGGPRPNGGMGNFPGLRGRAHNPMWALPPDSPLLQREFIPGISRAEWLGIPAGGPAAYGELRSRKSCATLLTSFLATTVHAEGDDYDGYDDGEIEDLLEEAAAAEMSGNKGAKKATMPDDAARSTASATSGYTRGASSSSKKGKA